MSKWAEAVSVAEIVELKARVVIVKETWKRHARQPFYDIKGAEALESYRSAAKAATAEIIRNKSRFIAYVAPVDTVEEAEAMLASLREKHRDAAHVCFAYRTGRPSLAVRMSDDGEPQGTAGRPILDVLERQDLENTCIAVVRYFGGTLLGAAGLVRAYAAAAAAGLEAAGIATYILHATLSFRLDYAYYNKVQRILEDMGTRIVETTFEDAVEVRVVTPVERVREVVDAVTNATNGSVVHSRLDDRFFPDGGGH